MLTLRKMATAFIIVSGLAFNNCTDGQDVSFNSLGEKDFLIQCAKDVQYDPKCPNVYREQFVKSYKTAPTDILFVLDDSCSMATIANSMAQGFSSLLNYQYPANTLMGLTYMAPATLNSDITFDFLRPYHQNVPEESPGFIRLVNQNSIEDYTTSFPNHSSSFSKVACQSDWFSPGQTSASGDFCLESVAQLAPICTGVEAGLVTLEQLIEKYTATGDRLFRNNSFVNIVLVSDTHEPGANYFGREGAPERMKTFAELVSVINTNSPNIASLKFSGILPLPVVGHPFYDGLNVSGPKPQNEEEAKINSEKSYDFSYLPYINQTGGVVAHANTSDWSALAGSIIAGTKQTGTLVISLKKKPTKIRFVNINGAELPKTDWDASSDGTVITIRYSSSTDQELAIDVIYEINAPNLKGDFQKVNLASESELKPTGKPAPSAVSTP